MRNNVFRSGNQEFLKGNFNHFKYVLRIALFEWKCRKVRKLNHYKHTFKLYTQLKITPCI
jgi:hypothetical protein